MKTILNQSKMSLALASVLALGAAGAFAVAGGQAPAGRAPGEPVAASATTAIETAVAKVSSVTLAFVGEAVVEARHQATVGAQVPGRILEVNADAGSVVRRGAVLMRIDEREAAHALSGSQAQLAQAKAEYERSRRLFEQKFISQAALDRAEAQFRQAEAGTGQAQTVRDLATVRAPFDGVVAQRHAELGEMAMPGRILMTVYDPTELRAVVSVPQARMAMVQGRHKAKVEFAEQGRWVEGASVTVLPAADAQTHVLRVRVDLPRGTEGVVPGMFARVHIVSGEAQKMTLPAGAIMRRGEVNAVYVADAAGRFAMRQVRLGEQQADGGFEVLSGLAEGERYALNPVRAAASIAGAAQRQGR